MPTSGLTTVSDGALRAPSCCTAVQVNASSVFRRRWQRLQSLEAAGLLHEDEIRAEEEEAAVESQLREVYRATYNLPALKEVRPLVALHDAALSFVSRSIIDQSLVIEVRF